MDATFRHDLPRETFEDERYRDHLITYDRKAAIFSVSHKNGYRRGIGALRKDAKRWVDLLIAGEVR